MSRRSSILHIVLIHLLAVCAGVMGAVPILVRLGTSPSVAATAEPVQTCCCGTRDGRCCGMSCCCEAPAGESQNRPGSPLSQDGRVDLMGGTFFYVGDATSLLTLTGASSRFQQRASSSLGVISLQTQRVRLQI